MKKMIVVLTFAVFTLSFAVTIWSEGFEHGGSWPADWTYSDRWTITGPGYDGSSYAARGQVSQPFSEWCKSPTVNWTNYGNRVLHFYYKFYQNNPTSTFIITIAGQLYIIDEPAVGGFHYYEISIPDAASSSKIEWRLVTALSDNNSSEGNADLIDDSAWLDSVWVTGTLIGIDEEETQITENQISKLEVYPNPFRQMTDIRYQVTYDGLLMTDNSVQLKIYDSSGRLVRQWDNKTIGQFDQISWNGTNSSNRELPVGVYFIQLQTPDQSITKKIIKLK